MGVIPEISAEDFLELVTQGSSKDLLEKMKFSEHPDFKSYMQSHSKFEMVVVDVRDKPEIDFCSLQRSSRNFLMK
jgi:hypothetical protein